MTKKIWGCRVGYIDSWYTDETRAREAVRRDGGKLIIADCEQEYGYRRKSQWMPAWNVSFEEAKRLAGQDGMVYIRDGKRTNVRRVRWWNK